MNYSGNISDISLEIRNRYASYRKLQDNKIIKDTNICVKCILDRVNCGNCLIKYHNCDWIM